MTPDGEALRRRLLDEFPEAAGREDEVRLVRAPGRVNLIGEHTDYNDGWVLPAAIDLETWIAYLAAGDARVELVLASDGARDGFDLDAIGPPRESWIDTVAGMAWSLGAAGMPLRGVRGVVATTIPIGSGLSSSAALQVAAAWAMSERHPPTEPMELALLARRAENEYVGVRSGVMDQFASAHGRSDAALLLDCRSLEWEPVPLPLEQYAVVVCDTRSPRRLETSEYNRRRAQCDEAVQVIARHHPGVASLRDVTAQMLDGTPDLDAVVRHRAEHVVHENRRVLEAVDALRDGDLARVGRLFAESHRSLRDQYEVTSLELDALVEIASRTPGVAAARMTGAGFGGCTVNLVEHGAVERLAAAVAEEYPRRARRAAGVYRRDLAPGRGGWRGGAGGGGGGGGGGCRVPPPPRRPRGRRLPGRSRRRGGGGGVSDPTAKRAAEVERRVDVVRRVAADAGARGVLLASRHNFAWLTVGGLNHVLLATERGAVPLLVSADRSVALAPINEAARIADEELAGLPLEILETPWAEAADPHPVAERLAGGPVVDDDAVEQALLPRRSQLVPLEHERLAELGRTAAAATDEVVGSTSADDSEHEVGAELTHRLLRQGIRAPVVLVAADERIARYRHPLPTGRRVGHRVMVVLVAECDGLHVALTRIAELEPPSADLALRIRGAEDVLRAMRDATRPGATLGSVLAAGQRAYATAGFGEEWRYHHQGGSIGYRARERIAVPGDPTPIVPGMAFAWNPSIAGAKAEETILLDPAGEARILT